MEQKTEATNSPIAPSNSPSSSYTAQQENPPQPTPGAQGTRTTPNFHLPLSPFSSLPSPCPSIANPKDNPSNLSLASYSSHNPLISRTCTLPGPNVASALRREDWS